MTTRILIALILFWTFAQAVQGQTVDQARSYLTQWEGRTNTVVIHPSGERTVGIGHNVAFDKVVKPRYTDAEVEALFVRDFVLAMGACRRGVKGFDALPLDVRLVVVSLAYTVGPTGFQRFQRFRLALGNRHYEDAERELRTSKWATQVSRARRDQSLEVLRKHFASQK